MAMRDFDLEAAAARARRAYDAEGLAGLAENDRILVAIWALEADVNNGGFDQFYFNSMGGLGPYASSALRTIGAIRMAELVEAANKHFGPDGPPEDRERRQAQLQKLSESAEDLFEELDREFWGYPDDIAALLRVHLTREPAP